MCAALEKKSPFLMNVLKIHRNIFSEMILLIKDEKYVQLDFFFFYTLQYSLKVYINFIFSVCLAASPSFIWRKYTWIFTTLIYVIVVYYNMSPIADDV